jgi:hypothetical protein
MLLAVAWRRNCLAYHVLTFAQGTGSTVSVPANTGILALQEILYGRSSVWPQI